MKLQKWQLPRNTPDMTLKEVWKRDVDNWVDKYVTEVEKYRYYLEDEFDVFERDLIAFIEFKEHQIGVELGIISPWEKK